MQRVFIESIEDVVYGHLQMHRTYSSGKLSIIVRGVEGKKLRQPTLVVAASGNHPALTIRAKEAEIWSDPKERKLHVRFHDFEVSGPITVTNPENLRAGNLARRADRHVAPKRAALRPMRSAKSAPQSTRRASGIRAARRRA